MCTYTSSSSTKTAVTFTDVEIIEFPITLGDHPSCQEGPAISMATSCESRIIVNVEEYEAVRSCCRRHSRDLVLSYEERCQRLKQNGIQIVCNSPTKSNKNKKKLMNSMSMMTAIDQHHEERLCNINDQLEKLMARLDLLNSQASSSPKSSCCCDDSEESVPVPPNSISKQSSTRSERGRVTLTARCA